MFGFVHGVENRQVEVGGATFAGRHAADHLGAIGDGLFGVEGALRAGEALTDDLGVFVYRELPWVLAFHRFNDFLRAVFEVVSRNHVKTGVFDNLFAEFHVGAFEAHHKRNLEADFFHCGDQRPRRSRHSA